MSRCFFVFALIVWGLSLSAQPAYFQQQTDFKIQASLDDERHQLQGQWELEYHNNSPDTLMFIYLHLWANAYSTRTTAFAEQLLRSENTDFYFAPEEDLGFIDQLDFSAEGQKISIQTTEYGPDVVQLLLNKPLAPGEKLTIETPFRLQFPASFSRLGHVGQSYQATQWYPKPAVYDRAGWHPMSYLDYGEYYSEFGTFEVTLTLPKNYLIGATGELQNPAERDWLLQRAQQDAQLNWTASAPEVWEAPAFPPSVTERKTLRYRAENVHDFAWFADKRFHVLHDTLQLANNTVDVWSFFTDEQANLWQSSLKYMKRSTRFYSTQVGEYPYPQVTAVQSALSAGSGMEYPMVTVIGWESDARALDGVLAHEIGHNWFYGILASNERDHAWMDEGFNSYYDYRYDQKYYGPVEPLLPPLLRGKSKTSLDEQGHRYYACQHLNQAPDTPGDDMRQYNYWVGSYSIPQMALVQLEQHWGAARIDAAMQAYYEAWKFKHPQPVDAQNSFENAGGEDLSWLFHGFMESVAFQDYAIKKVSVRDSSYVTLVNKGEIAGPVQLTAQSPDGEVNTVNLAGFRAEKTIALPQDNYQAIHLDEQQLGLDVRRSNNHWSKGLWGKRPAPELRFAFGERNEERSPIFVSPLLGFNEYDGIMPGLLLHNRGVLPRRIEWAVTPLYGTRNNSLDGFAGFRWRLPIPRNERVRELQLFSTFRRFHFSNFAPEDLSLAYGRSSTGLNMTFFQAKGSRWVPTLQYRFLHIAADDLRFNNKGIFIGTATQTQASHELNVQLERKWILAPMKINFTLEQLAYTDDFRRDQQATKLRVEASGKMLYQSKKALYWRFFGGFFLAHSLPEGTYSPSPAFSLFDRGLEDYRFDNLYLKRQGGANITGRQLGLRDGGFRAAVANGFGVGRSNKRMLSINLSADLPFTPDWFALKPYLDAASFLAPTFEGDQNEFLWVGGLSLELFDGKVALFAPLTGSDAIMDRLREKGGLGQRIGLRLLFTELTPWKWLDSLENW